MGRKMHYPEWKNHKTYKTYYYLHKSRSIRKKYITEHGEKDLYKVGPFLYALSVYFRHAFPGTDTTAENELPHMKCSSSSKKPASGEGDLLTAGMKRCCYLRNELISQPIQLLPFLRHSSVLHMSLCGIVPSCIVCFRLQHAGFYQPIGLLLFNGDKFIPLRFPG